MVKIINLRVEHYEGNALGIGQNKPRISWSFEGDDEDWYQTAYELELERYATGRETFVVKSCDSVLVPWPGHSLVSHELVQIRVRTTDQNSVWTDWSNPYILEAGLLDPKEWQCNLIEANDSVVEEITGGHRPVVFRCELEDVKSFQRARLYITAHGVYEARINGKKVGDHLLAPGWTVYTKRLLYQTLDATMQLRAGKNVIEVTVADGWYCGRLGFMGKRNIYGPRLGLMAMLCIFDEGNVITHGTSELWKWTYGPVQASSIYDGETFDTRAQISNATDYYDVQSSQINDTLIPQESPPIKVTEELPVQKIITTPSGKTIVDIGQNIAGWLRINGVDGEAGTEIILQFAEVLENGEIGTRPLRTAKCQDKVILDGKGPLTWEPMGTFHGFRYVQIENWPKELQPGDVTAIVVHTDMKRKGHFRCSNPLLNKLHQNVVWSMRDNFVGLPTDCPQRDERLGWTGDINIFGETASYLFDVTGLLSSWLLDMSAEQDKMGGTVPLIVPNLLEDFGPAKQPHSIWGDVAVMLPWSLYQATGDDSILVQQYESMKAWLISIPRSPSGLWDQNVGDQLGDWLDPAAPPAEPGNGTTDGYLVSDAFLVHITTLMNQAAAALGRTEDAARYFDEQIALRAAYAREYITATGRLACDTQTAYGLTLAFSIFPTAEQQKLGAKRLSQLILKRSRFKIATGFAGTPYLGFGLSNAGMSNIFYRMLLHRANPSWLYPITMGATTIWERWDSMLPDGSINPGEMTSFNHYALGAVADWMHKVIAGLKMVEPGWKIFAVEPEPGGGLQWAEASHVSPYGLCSVQWELRKGIEEQLWIRVRVPPNTKARVRVARTNLDVEVGSGIREWIVPYQSQEWPVRAVMPPFTPPDDVLPDDEVLQCPWKDEKK